MGFFGGKGSGGRYSWNICGEKGRKSWLKGRGGEGGYGRVRCERGRKGGFGE